MDYATLNSKGEDSSTKAQVKKRCTLYKQALRGIEAFLAERKLSKAMRFPLLDQGMNVVDPMLGMQLAPRWMEAFAGAAPRGTVASVDMLHSPLYRDFQRAHSMLHLRLSYKRAINEVHVSGALNAQRWFGGSLSLLSSGSSSPVQQVGKDMCTLEGALTRIACNQVVC